MTVLLFRISFKSISQFSHHSQGMALRYAYPKHPEARSVPKSFRSMLAAIPKVVFLVRIEGDNYISSVSDIRAAFGGHNYWLSFLFRFTGNEYMGNVGQGQKEKGCCPSINAYII
jgi:hypothetical protein